MARNVGSQKLSEAVALAIKEGRARSLRQYAPMIGFEDYTYLVKWMSGDQKPVFASRQKLENDPGIPMGDWDVPLELRCDNPTEVAASEQASEPVPDTERLVDFADLPSETTQVIHYQDQGHEQ